MSKKEIGNKIGKVKGYIGTCERCWFSFGDEEMIIYSNKRECVDALFDNGWEVKKGKLLCEDCKVNIDFDIDSKKSSESKEGDC